MSELKINQGHFKEEKTFLVINLLKEISNAKGKMVRLHYIILNAKHSLCTINKTNIFDTISSKDVLYTGCQYTESVRNFCTVVLWEHFF